VNGVTVTISQAGSTYVVLLAYDSDPYGIVYAMSFHITFEAAFDAAYAYLYNGALKPHSSIRLAEPRPAQYHKNIALSDETWTHFNEQTREYKYNGHASYLGVSVYLLALLTANPDPTDWSDNRGAIEPDLPDYNIQRLEDGQLPRWNDDDFNERDPGQRRRKIRTFPTLKLRKILELLEPIARAHVITPHRTIIDFEDYSRWAGAALEAIGLKYLVPKNPPQVNPTPAKRNRKHLRDKKRANETYPFY